MHLRLWITGIGMGVLLVLGGILAGPIESFAASGTPTTQQVAATPQAQGSGTSSTAGQNSGTPQTQNSGGASSSNNMVHGCPQGNHGGSNTNGSTGANGG